MSESRPMGQPGQSDSSSAARVTQPIQLAYIGPDGQIFVRRFPSDTSHQLTWSWQDQQAHYPPQDPQAPEAQPPPPSMTYSWPTWSPDSAQLACFARQGEDGPASVYTVAGDGVESWERASLGQGAPIYGSWSPQADMFTVLVQRGERQLALGSDCHDPAWPDAHPAHRRAALLVMGSARAAYGSARRRQRNRAGCPD